MFSKVFTYLKGFDLVLFFSVFLLACLGLTEIYSISIGRNQSDLINFKKQFIFIIIGIIISFIFLFINYKTWKDFSWYLYIFAIILLISVLFFGSTIKGTTGWFKLGYFNIQPVEFVKIILIIFLAKFFESQKQNIKELRVFVISGVQTFILFLLVMLQPDFGSAMILFSIWIIMIFVAGVKKRYFFIIAILGVTLFSLSWIFYFKNYQKERIITFIRPDLNSLDKGYNVAQAVIAVGSGGIWGSGVGFGTQSQLKFLPEAQNDFIFAVIAEELGFIGVMLVISLFSLFFYRCFVSLKYIKDDFACYFIIGSMGLIFIQMSISIGMNIGIFPVVGISLPFVSYGGSSLIVMFVLVGIIESAIVRSRV